jgi:hypothetical protein
VVARWWSKVAWWWPEVVRRWLGGGLRVAWWEPCAGLVVVRRWLGIGFVVVHGGLVVIQREIQTRKIIYKI